MSVHIWKAEHTGLSYAMPIFWEQGLSLNSELSELVCGYAASPRIQVSLYPWGRGSRHVLQHQDFMWVLSL